MREPAGPSADQTADQAASGGLLPLVVLVGPTAVGKTELSLRLCEQLGGEVVSADSRQIYRGMDIGTAKASAAEQARVPHHLLDVRSPEEVLTLAEYQRLAYDAIAAIHARGRVPFLVGGSALYVRAVTAGLRIPEVPPNPALRTQLEAELARDGLGRLAARLAQLDPLTAGQIDQRNPRRVLRALEIVLITGQPKVALEGAEPPPYRILQVALTRERGSLHRRIDARVEQMVADGLIEETQRLLAAGYAPNLPAMTSLGYREIIAYLAGEMTLAQAVARIQIETHRFVRHQMTWFRKMAGLVWFDLGEQDVSEIGQLTARWLAGEEGAPHAGEPF
jgi:tRNA dimethylallyltransferase